MSPRLMLLERVVYVGCGLDVEFMMVDGRVLMENRAMPGIDADRIIADANQAARNTYQRAGQLDLLVSHPHTWGHPRY